MGIPSLVLNVGNKIWYRHVTQLQIQRKFCVLHKIWTLRRILSALVYALLVFHALPWSIPDAICGLEQSWCSSGHVVLFWQIEIILHFWHMHQGGSVR